MTSNDNILRFVGSIEMQMADSYGRPIGPVMFVNNMVVDAGRAWIGAKVQSSSPPSNTISHLAVGTSQIASVNTMTSLVGEVFRIAIASMITATLTGTAPYWQALGTFATSDANTTLAEFGLFNSSSGGTMIARAVLATTISKSSTQTLNYTYTVSF